MERYFHFLTQRWGQVTLPVTPKSYTWGAGKSIEIVNISEVGDVTMAGKPTRYAGKIECMFPASAYPWLAPGAVVDPYYYVDIFATLAASGEVIRFIVSGTDVNAQALVESIDYTEQDGTGDVYATISLREWVDLAAVTVSNLDTSAGAGGTQNSGQAREQGQRGGEQYTVVAGDCLSVICRRYYGNSSSKYYNALAKYNNIPNPHLIHAGDTLTIPPAEELLGG